MPSSDPQPPAEPELVWLLHSTLVWALTGALMTIARRPAWSAIGVVLTVLGLGVAGWVVRRLLHQRPPRQPTNRVFPPIPAPGHARGVTPRRRGGRHERVPTDPESGQPTASKQH
jgi:hypothetical protein